MIRLMRIMGLTNQSFIKRLIILGVGIIPYACIGVVWNWANEVDILWLSTIVWVFLFAVIAGFFRIQEPKPFETKWPTVIAFNVVGIGLVVGILLMISFQKSSAASYQVQSFSTRPEVFPDVLVCHPMAKEPLYIIVYKKLYTILDTTIPESFQSHCGQSLYSRGWCFL